MIEAFVARFGADGLQAVYMAGAVALLCLVWSLARFDLRSLKRGERAADMLERPDLGALLSLLVVGGTALAALIGWRVPAEIERIWGAGAGFGLLFPSVEMTTMGRAAQVVGAVCLGLVALRLLRILVVFAAAGMLAAATLAAADYVFRLGTF